MRQPSRQQIVSLLIRRYPYGHPNPFRSVRHLRVRPCPRFMFVRSLGRSFAPVAPSVAPSTMTPWSSSLPRSSTGDVTAHCPAQTPPPNPIAAEPGDGRVRSRPSSRVHEPCSPTRSGCPAVTDGLDGFRESQILLRRVRGRTPTLPPACRLSAAPVSLALSAWEAWGAVVPPPADWLTCGSAGALTVRDRDCPLWLLRSGT
jgi:hypothetical protein